MSKAKEQSQMNFLLGYFKKNPNKDIKHPEIVDWATKSWKRKTGKILRDPDRAIRKLHQDGYLIKAKKGVYRYDPKLVNNRKLEDFTLKIRQAIFKRDKNKCIICGRGKSNGIEIHADHIKPKDKGGRATLENGQTLCSQHNFLKKNYGQTTLGKRYFIRLHKTAKRLKDKKLAKFCSDVLGLFDKYDIDVDIKK